MGVDGWTLQDNYQFRELLTKACTDDFLIIMNAVESEMRFRCIKYKKLLAGEKIDF